MQVSDYKADLLRFTLMHLVFLELGTHHFHLGFKLLDENNNAVIPGTFYLQLLNKAVSIYGNEITSKIYPDRNPTASQEYRHIPCKTNLKLKHIFLIKFEFVKALKNMK